MANSRVTLVSDDYATFDDVIEKMEQVFNITMNEIVKYPDSVKEIELKDDKTFSFRVVREFKEPYIMYLFLELVQRSKNTYEIWWQEKDVYEYTVNTMIIFEIFNENDNERMKNIKRCCRKAFEYYKEGKDNV